MTLLVMWTVYAVFGVILYSLVFLWAVRTRQFSSEQRARRMPLEYPPAVHSDVPPKARSWPTLAVPAVILLIGAAAVIAAVICSYLR